MGLPAPPPDDAVGDATAGCSLLLLVVDTGWLEEADGKPRSAGDPAPDSAGLLTAVDPTLTVVATDASGDADPDASAVAVVLVVVAVASAPPEDDVDALSCARSVRHRFSSVSF